MTPINTSKNYSGRTVDLLIFQGMEEIIEGKVTLSFSDNPKVVTGIQKVAQQYAITFLTDIGSVLADQDFGVEPPGLIGVSNVNSDQITQKVSIGVFDAYTAVRDAQLTDEAEGLTIPDDEVLTNAELVKLAIDKDRVAITIKLETRAGASRTYVIPVTTATGLTK